MGTRREIIQSVSVVTGALLSGVSNNALAMNNAKKTWLMPDECEPHKRTWMAFGAQRRTWGGKLLPEVQQTLALIARTIATFEPVSMLVRREEVEVARKLVGRDIDLIDAIAAGGGGIHCTTQQEPLV